MIDICVDNLLFNNWYKDNFAKINSIVPHSIKKRLLHELFKNDNYSNNEEPPQIKNWFDITQNQLIELLYSDRMPFDCIDDSYFMIVHRHENTKCYACTDVVCRDYVNRSLYECKECYTTITGYYTLGNELDEFIFKPSNWCSKCLVKPLFNIVKNFNPEIFCLRCKQIYFMYNC